MPSLIQIQQEFIALLQNGDRNIEHRVIQQGKLSNAQRIDIYSSGYRIRLRGVIDSDHANLGKYLGDDLFDEMVEGYINSMPSQHSSLRFYADKLPEYLRNTSPFSDHSILAEIAGFERTLLNAFDSADATPLSEQALLQITPEKWPEIMFTFHPSLKFYQCHWNAIESWQQLKHDESPPPPEFTQQIKKWAVWRNPIRLTEYKSLQELEQKVVDCMLQGQSFSQACEGLSNDLPPEQMASTLLEFIVGWLQRGWITKIKSDRLGVSSTV